MQHRDIISLHIPKNSENVYKNRIVKLLYTTLLQSLEQCFTVKNFQVLINNIIRLSFEATDGINVFPCSLMVTRTIVR